MIKEQTFITNQPVDKQVPLSPMGRCPKLTRYKLVSGLIIITFSILLMVTTLSKTDGNLIKDSSKVLSFYSFAVYHSTDTKLPDGLSSADVENIDNSTNKGNILRRIGSTYVGCGSQQTGGRHLKKRLPSAIVIGARKAGTRALLRFINLHPDVVTSRQETHFFDRYYDEGFDWYRHQMPYSFEGQVTVEKTPNYFVDWDVPERVFKFNSSIKLILIVRNPIDRAVSDYVQLKEKFYKSGHQEFFGSFEDLVFDKTTGQVNKSYAPIKRSLYSRHLETWLTFFQMSQLFVVDGENIKAKPWEEMYKLEAFLGLPHMIGRDRFVYNQTKGFYCVRLDKVSKEVAQSGRAVQDFILRSKQCLTDNKGRNHPILTNQARQELSNFFKPFNKRFFTTIGKTFDWT